MSAAGGRGALVAGRAGRPAGANRDDGASTRFLEAGGAAAVRGSVGMLSTTWLVVRLLTAPTNRPHGVRARAGRRRRRMTGGADGAGGAAVGTGCRSASGAAPGTASAAVGASHDGSTADSAVGDRNASCVDSSAGSASRGALVSRERAAERRPLSPRLDLFSTSRRSSPSSGARPRVEARRSRHARSSGGWLRSVSGRGRGHSGEPAAAGYHPLRLGGSEPEGVLVLRGCQPSALYGGKCCRRVVGVSSLLSS